MYLETFYIWNFHDIIWKPCKFKKFAKVGGAETFLSLKRHTGDIKFLWKRGRLPRISLGCILQMKQMKRFLFACPIYIQTLSYSKPMFALCTTTLSASENVFLFSVLFRGSTLKFRIIGREQTPILKSFTNPF